MSFNAEEKAYLGSQRIARFATVSSDGQPDVAPVGFELADDVFYIGGMNLTATRKYRNVVDGNRKIALVVDDIVSETPWVPRFVRVYGTADVVQRDGSSGSGEYLRVSPTVSWSWNLDGRPFTAGEQAPPRKVVHGSANGKAETAPARPVLGNTNSDAGAIVAAFAAGLQSGHDHHDADILNRQFAADVAWGSPFGALVDGYDRLHAIHAGFQRDARDEPAFRYQVRHVLPVGDDVIVAHIARVALDESDRPRPPSANGDEPFSEMAMFVLVRRGGEWWLAAGQNTPMRPGGAVPATTST